MKKHLKQVISIILAAMMVWSSADVSAYAASAKAEDGVTVSDAEIAGTKDSVIVSDAASDEAEGSELISEYDEADAMSASGSATVSPDEDRVIGDSIDQNDEIEALASDAVTVDNEEISSLGSGSRNCMEVSLFNGKRSVYGNGNRIHLLDNIDLRGVEYIKVDYDFGGAYTEWNASKNRTYDYYKKSCTMYLVDSTTGKDIAPCISRTQGKGENVHNANVFRYNNNCTWKCANASIVILLHGIDIPDTCAWLRLYSIIVGYNGYCFTINTNYNNNGKYQEKIYTGEGRYEYGEPIQYPQPYFTDGNGKHVVETLIHIGQTVNASVWEGGGTNSQGVKADGGTVNFRGFKLAKPGATGELSDFITTGASFTFDQNFLNKYKDYLSSDGTFTLVPVYEPKGQAVQFINDYATVDGKSDAKGVFDGFRSGYTQGATKLDTIRVSAKANSGYRISYLILQSPNGAREYVDHSKKWTRWATQSDSRNSGNPTTLEAAINYKGNMWNSSMTNVILNKNLCRVIIYYDDAAATTGSLIMAPSPQSVNEGANGKLTFVSGPGVENDPNLHKVVASGETITIDNTHINKPYIFGATSKSGFHAYWKDGTLDSNGDGSDDTSIPGYEPFRTTFGDQFKFIPKVPVKNKVYYNFVKDVNVAKEVKPLPIKGYLLLGDQLLISGKKVQKGLSGITVFASGFTGGQEVTTNERGYYELKSNEMFKYYDLYDYNVTFTGESEAGTIGVVYSQNPNNLGNVVVDAIADVDITDTKLLIEQNKKDGSGKEYLTVDTSEAKLYSSDYYPLPGGDRNYRLQMSAHRGSEVLTKGVLTFTNTNGKKVSIEGTEDATHSGLFTFDFNPKAKGIAGGATARVMYYTGDRALLSRDTGLKVADGIGTIRIINPLTGVSSVQSLGVNDDALSAGLIPAAGQPVTMDWCGEFDDIADSLSAAYMDGTDRVICVGFGRKILSAGGEKDMLINLARTAAAAQEEAGEAASAVTELKKQIAATTDTDRAALEDRLREAEIELSFKTEIADKAQGRLDDKIKAIQSECTQQAEFDDGLSMDLGYSLLMTFGYDDENGMWYFKDMLCISSVDADSDTTANYETGLGLSTGVNKHLSAGGRATFVAEERQDVTDADRKNNRYYITEDNKDGFDILSVAGNGEGRRLDSYGRLNLNPEITLTGFSGYAGDLVQVDVDGRAVYDPISGASSDSTGACTSNASVKIRMMNYTDTIPLLSGIYQTGENDSDTVAADALGADAEGSYKSRSIDTLQAENLSYMEGDDTWYGGWDDKSLSADGEILSLGAIDDGGSEAYSESALANRIAPDAGYDMVSLGDGKFAAVFLNVAQSRIRDKDNAKAAYYTYYDGNAWSEPVILEDDGTLDLYPHIYSLDGRGALVLWSTVADEYKDSADKIARQNALDLHGRFVSNEGSLDENIIKVTGTVADAIRSEVIGADEDAGTEAYTEGSELAADRAIGVTAKGDNLVIVYEKRSYKNSGAEATVGDMLYPESTQIAYRTFDLAANGFKDGAEDGNASGQKLFDGYLPGVELYEDLDDKGYYRTGGSATKAVKLDDPQGGLLLDSDMTTFTYGDNVKGVLAYTVDTDGNLGTASGRDLYLATYDFDTDSFSKPVILTGYNVNPDVSGNARPENSSPKFVAATDALYLMWLRDGDIVSMNVLNLLQNETALVKDGELQGISYRYIDKTPYSEGMSAAYDAPVVLVSGSSAEDADSQQTGAISAFGAETDGRYIYVIWPQAADDKPESIKDGLKDIQMWGIRAEVTEGAMSNVTSPVQITSHYGERYDDVAFGVYDGAICGMASRIPSRMITESEAREIFADSFDAATFVPYAIWDDTGAAPVTFKISGTGAARIRNAGFTSAKAGENATFSFEIHNYSFNDLNGAKVTAVDKDGNRCTLYRYIPSETEDTEGETVEAAEITINGLRGGDAYTVTGSVAIPEDAKNAEVTITLTDADGRSEDYTKITAELTSDITLQDISISDTGVRNLYLLQGKVANVGTARADAGVIDLVVSGKSQEKVLKQIEYPSLMPGESYDFDEDDKNDAHDDTYSYVLLEVSDDDFAVTEGITADSATSDDQTPAAEDPGANEGQAKSSEYVSEKLELYAVYSGGMSEYRIPVSASANDAKAPETDGFITRSISESELVDIGYVTGVQIDAVKASTDEEGYLVGEVVSSGKGMITLEAGETVDIQAKILTNSPRKGAQVSLDEEGKVVDTSTGTEGLIYHYEYIGDNAEINTDGMLHTLGKGSGRIKVYVYPDTSGYMADNDDSVNNVEIEGEQFSYMDDEDSYVEDAFHNLPSAAIRTFVLDVNIVDSGERPETTASSAVNGIQYRILNAADVAVCGLKDGESVKTLNIPATVTIEGKKYNVTRIDAYAFNKDSNIEKLSIGKNVTSIGSCAFEGCDNLSKVTFGSGLVQIGERAFKGCTKISSVTLPAKLERMEAEAFCGCESLKNLVIPASVTYIGDRAFYGCTGLGKITIKSEKLTGDKLGKDVFLGVPLSAEYNLAIKDAGIKNELSGKLTEASEQVTDKKGIVYRISSKGNRTLTVSGLTEAAAAKLKSVSIPAQVTFKGSKYTVTGIADGAFENNALLNKVTIPKTVTAIGDRAFANDTALKSAVIPASVVTLGEEAYSGCIKLGKVTIASSALTVGEDAFKGVPDTAVFKYSFKGDEAVRKLSEQLLTGTTVFVSKAGLRYEVLDPDLTGVVLTGFTNKNIKNLSVPDTVNYRGVKLSVISVKDGAFAYHKALKKVVLGKNVFEIYPDAFAGCTALTSVTMKKVQNISFSAFTGCISLKKITIPKTVKEIGNEAFDGCTSLSAITIQSATPTLLNAVGADAFDDISVNAYIKIQARPADKETIKTLLTEAGVDPTRIK